MRPGQDGSLQLSFHGLEIEARPSGALFLPKQRWLTVSDLHLGRSERYARRGGALLPPYEVAETLRRLTAEIQATEPDLVISLGDGFDDDAAAEGLAEGAAETLAALQASWRWEWLAGNHDPKAGAAELSVQGVVLRHIVGTGPDISGHFHPVAKLAGRRYRCFAIGPQHLIMPAFGVYTGGLAASDKALRPYLKGGIAVVCAHQAIAIPI